MRHRPGVEAEEIRPRSDMVDFADETRRPKEVGSVGSVGRSFRQKGVKPYRGVGGDFWSEGGGALISRSVPYETILFATQPTAEGFAVPNASHPQTVL